MRATLPFSATASVLTGIDLTTSAEEAPSAKIGPRKAYPPRLLLGVSPAPCMVDITKLPHVTNCGSPVPVASSCCHPDRRSWRSCYSLPARGRAQSTETTSNLTLHANVVTLMKKTRNTSERIIPMTAPSISPNSCPTFLEWTEGDRLRHSKSVALREDKSPHDVVKEQSGGS